MSKINLYIFDIDGVVADISHRLHYMHEKNYEKIGNIHDNPELLEVKK